MKRCIKCDIDKNFDDFSLGRNVCKTCISDYQKEWRKKNKKKMAMHSKNYRQNNLKKVKSFQKNWYENNSENAKEYSKNYRKDNQEKVKKTWREYRKNNKEKIKKQKKEYYEKNKEWLKEYSVNYRRNNENARIAHNIRTRIRQFLNSKNITKNNNTFEIIGCTPNQLKEHLEKQFKNGMNWQNYGYYGWHIDHIIPLDSAKNDAEIYELCHYTNLQPLWSVENLSKNNKII